MQTGCATSDTQNRGPQPFVTPILLPHQRNDCASSLSRGVSCKGNSIFRRISSVCPLPGLCIHSMGAEIQR